MLDDLGLGLQLRTVRQERGWTQQEVADRADLSNGKLICEYERGRAEPTVPTLRKLATALGVSPGRLLEGDGDVHPG